MTTVVDIPSFREQEKHTFCVQILIFTLPISLFGAVVPVAVVHLHCMVDQSYEIVLMDFPFLFLSITCEMTLVYGSLLTICCFVRPSGTIGTEERKEDRQKERKRDA
jgi:hypothetical protein